MSQSTATYADVPATDKGVATKPNALALHTHLSANDARALWDVLLTRAGNRHIERYDAVVTLDSWATRGRYDIADSRVLLCGSVSDHSEKAYHCRGAFEVDMDEIVDFRYINNVVSQVDSTSAESVDNYGETYVPKKAVDAIVQIRGD